MEAPLAAVAGPAAPVRRRRRWRWAAGGSALFVLLVCGALTAIVGSPRNWWGFLRYGLPGLHAGRLVVGDPAPDVELHGLDGTRFRLRERVGPRPLVVVFGSFT